LDLYTEFADYRKVEYDGVLDLLKAAVKRMQIEEGLDIYVRADAPPGCGTGTSASVGVALVSALAYWKGEPLLPYQAAKMAHSLETEELALESGVQDQYAAAYGGISHMDIEYPLVQIAPVTISPSTVCQLESRWILVYLGSRKSSDMHLQVIENYQRGDMETLAAHNRMKSLASEMVGALRKSNFNDIARIMNENWECQQKLHPAITNNRIQELEQLAMDCEAVGFKVNGAGGGGSAVIMAGAGKEYRLKKQLLDNQYIIFPCTFNFHGVQIWSES
jgi:D-glycero-alpha-D-manno-heptose-7-phosphate kinase